MLSPEQVKPLLAHADFHVREAAINYFSDSYSPDSEILPRVLAALPAEGDARLSVLAQCHGLAVNDEGLTALLGCLGREEDRLARRHLLRIVGNAPLGLLAARLAELEPVVGDDPEGRRDLRRYQKAASWPPERLWRRLQKEARQEEPDTGLADLLIHALAPQAVPDEDTLLVLVTLKEGPSYLESFAIQLAGERRLRRAVAPLVDNLRLDEDFALEDSSRALVRIGDAEAARRIRQVWPTAEEWFRNFTSEVLGHLKHPEVEEVLLDLLEVEKDTSVRTGLCKNLCDLFSERGVEVVRRQIRSGYDTMLLCLEEHLLPVLDVLGIDLPEAPRWRKQRADQERHTASILEKFRQQSQATLPELPSAADEDWPEFDRPPAPIVHEGPRVGRNDPCPCGSGKKFKNCCLRRE